MDVKLDSSGDMVFENRVTTVTESLLESTTQRVRIRLLTFLGEWFLNTEYGVPYFQRIFQKATPKSVVDSIFKSHILDDRDVLALVEFNSTFDNVTRAYSMSFKIKCRDGTVSATQEIAIGV